MLTRYEDYYDSKSTFRLGISLRIRLNSIRLNEATNCSDGVICIFQERPIVWPFDVLPEISHDCSNILQG